MNRGNFSHRISAGGNDQLAELSRSFNSMTESIERLIEESKERQRLASELAIAREVPEQLFPKSPPAMRGLEILGVGNAARMVSGGYFDFVKLSEDRLAPAIGTGGFVWIEGWPWFDGFYMTLFPLTTVGYQELHGLSPTGRNFNSFLIAIGVTTVFLAIGVIAQFAPHAEPGAFFGRRRQKRMLDKLSDHSIVCGAGRAGRSVIRELVRRRAPFVLVGFNPWAQALVQPGDVLIAMGESSRLWELEGQVTGVSK